MAGILLLALLTASPSLRGERVDARCRNDRRISPAGLCGGESAPPPPTGPLFQFATASGDGMTAACACAPVTGTKGEAMTFTRASTAYCTKGNTLTGIANGDVVECAANQPVVMPGGDGTGGVGLAVWATRTNTALRSQEFENATWVKISNFGQLPIITANAAVAPDGTTTADRIQVPATTAVQSSQMYQNAFPQVPSMKGLFVRGVSGSGTLRMCSDSNNCVDCAYVSTSWERCQQTPTNGVYSQYVYIGNNVSASGRAASDAYIWQMDNFPDITSYLPPPIKTAGTAVTRAAETATFPVSSGGASEVSFSTAALLPAGLPTSVSILLTWFASSAPLDSYSRSTFTTTNKLSCTSRALAVSAPGVSSAASANPSALNVLSCVSDSATTTACVNGVCDSVAAPITLEAYDALGIGTTSGSLNFNGILKDVCADTTATGCAP